MSKLKLGIDGRSWMATLSKWATELRKQNFVVSQADVLQYVQQTPIGAPIAWLFDADENLPDNHIILDGSTLQVDDYPDLFKVYSYRFGGSGTTFQLPDLRGRYLMGVAASGTGNAVRGTFGAIDHDHDVTTSDHTHNVTTSDHTHTVKKHYHVAQTGDIAINGGVHDHALEYNLDNLDGTGTRTVAANPGVTSTEFTQTDGVHNHLNSEFSGSVGCLSGAGGVSGDIDQNSGSDGGETVASASDGGETVTSDGENPPTMAVHWITRYRDIVV